MALTPEQRKLRSRTAHAARRGDPAALEQARQDYKAVTAAEYIRKLVDEAPPLTAEQRDRLALLLRGAA